MKQALLGAICALFLFGCSGGGNKFVGKWQSVDGRMYPESSLLLIEKNGDQFVLKKSTNLNDTVVLTYNDEGKFLAGHVNGADIDIKYVESSQHITFGATGDTRFIEFKKVD